MKEYSGGDFIMHDHNMIHGSKHAQHDHNRQHQPEHSGHGAHQDGHDKHAGHSVAMFKDRFWLSLLLTIPVILYSEMVQEWLGFTMPKFPGSEWIPFVLGTIIFFYGGLVFIKSAWGELKDRQPGMMTLISLAILSAYLYSILTTFFIAGTEFFWELATLIVIMLFGHWMEMRSVMSAQGALNELAKLLPDTAELPDGKLVPVAELKVNDIILVRPGGKIAADGLVVEGESDVNESMITGESALLKKTSGSAVIAGTVNSTGSLKVQVSKVGDDTALAGIMRLVAEAQSSKSRAQILADRAAFYLTIVAILAAIATMIGWLLAGRDISFALERTVTVLVIACPHALGLAIPLVTSISTTLGARNGLLVKQRMALETARNINVVLFDKTGTLTKGEHGVVDVWPIQEDQSTLLRLAAAAEQNSEHIIGKAIVRKAKEARLDIPLIEQFRAVPGRGVEGVIRQDSIAVGGPELVRIKQALIPQIEQEKINQAGRDGKTVVYVFKKDTLIGTITLADVIRPESKQAVASLKNQGVRVAMLTGDSKAVAEYVAKELGLNEYFAEVLPEHKSDKVKELQKDGSKVAMVGDGVNDAPALTQADVGIAVGAGTDVAIESAGIVLVRSNPLDIPKIITLSQATYRKMVQNLFWATGYNVVAIPLAAGALASAGIILPPAIGALLMSVSTIVVALNAQLLRKLKL